MNIIGADESGNGDTFGGISVACVSMTDKEIKNVNPLIRDSKQLTDFQINVLATEIRRKYKYSEIIYEPEEYNKKYKSLNKIYLVLFDAYKKSLDKFNITKEDTVIIDKFTSSRSVEASLRAKYNKLLFIPRAEVHIPVACASILARDIFVRSIYKLTGEFGMTIPLGSVTSVIGTPLIDFVQRFSSKNLHKVSKTHFKRVDDIIRNDLFNTSKTQSNNKDVQNLYKYIGKEQTKSYTGHNGKKYTYYAIKNIYSPYK